MTVNKSQHCVPETALQTILPAPAQFNWTGQEVRKVMSIIKMDITSSSALLSLHSFNGQQMATLSLTLVKQQQQPRLSYSVQNLKSNSRAGQWGWKTIIIAIHPVSFSASAHLNMTSGNPCCHGDGEEWTNRWVHGYSHSTRFSKSPLKTAHVPRSQHCSSSFQQQN